MEKYERYISIEQSIIAACREVNLMQAGLKPKRTLEELWEKLDEELAENKSTEPAGKAAARA